RSFLLARAAAEQAGVAFRISQPSPAVRRMVERTGIHALLPDAQRPPPLHTESPPPPPAAPNRRAEARRPPVGEGRPSGGPSTRWLPEREARDGPPGPPHRRTVECVAYPNCKPARRHRGSIDRVEQVRDAK